MLWLEKVITNYFQLFGLGINNIYVFLFLWSSKPNKMSRYHLGIEDMYIWNFIYQDE